MKPVDAFAWRRIQKGQRANYCRPCRAAYKQEHYRANRQRYIAQARAVKDSLRIERGQLLLILADEQLGEWRSLVAHPAGGRAVAGSNPVSPTRRKPC